MSTTEIESATSQYVPFTPFQESYAFEPEPAVTRLQESTVANPVVSPFVSEYEGVVTQTPQASAFQELLYELYDHEFDETLADLAHEAWEAVAQRGEPLGEVGAGPSAEQFLDEWSRPVRQAAESMLDDIAQAASQHDLASMSEAEIDGFFEAFEPRETGLEQHFENFLGGLWSKVKSVAKKAASLAAQGVMLIPGLSGLISRLKALLKPLLDRVLRTAIDRLPPTLQPFAHQLAQRVLGVGETEAEPVAAAAGADLTAIQRRFDHEAASVLLAPNELEQELVVNEAVAADHDTGATVAQLHEARTRFVDQLEAGVDPEQAMEQFIPAVMAILPIARTAIGLIGRARVVNTLAGYLAGFVARYVPQTAASQLSTAIVDAGLRMLSLETSAEPETGPRIACEAVANAVEDTVRRVAELDESVFEEPQLFEAAVTQAFHEAAAENFPPQVLVPELHEAPLHATWVAMPRRGRRRIYKKYTHVFDVEITPQVAASVHTFGGTTLASFLRDRLGVTPPVRARVHVYQAIAGTTLGRIAHLERGVHGLGPGRHGGMQMHPLTVEAAAALLHHPRLGRDVDGAFRSARHAISIGQRFYYLEIAGARPVTVAVAGRPTHVAVRRTSDVNVALDFRRDEFRVFVYLSEADAQVIAAGIRRRDVTSVLLVAKRIYEAGLQVALGGDIARHVRVLGETAPEQLFGIGLKQLTANVRERVIKAVVAWVGQAIADYVKDGAGELLAAVENPADGVTLIVRIVNPPGAPLVRRLLSGEGAGAAALADLPSLFRGRPKLSVSTVAGFRFE